MRNGMFAPTEPTPDTWICIDQGVHYMAFTYRAKLAELGVGQQVFRFRHSAFSVSAIRLSAFRGGGSWPNAVPWSGLWAGECVRTGNRSRGFAKRLSACGEGTACSEHIVMHTEGIVMYSERILRI